MYCGGPNSCPEQSMWALWWTKWHSERLSLGYWVSHSHENGLLASSHPSVGLSARPTVQVRLVLGRYPQNLILGTLTNICRETQNLVKIGRKYQALYTNTQIRFILAGDIRVYSLQKHFLQQSIFLYCWVTCTWTIHAGYIAAFSLQKVLHERTTMLRYTCTAYIVTCQYHFTSAT
jgi:hypothetical protein